MQGFWLSLGVFLVLAAALVKLHLGMKQLRMLSDIAGVVGAHPPRVSVIFSALNEEATIEPALRSLLALDYPALEVIAIDDRSTDATGAILDRIASEHACMRVIHIRELPAGWLGKNHALHVGAQQATGDYLLFTDADVLFEPQALRRAVAYCEAHALDHLVVMAEFIVREQLLASLLLNFLSGGFLLHPPWKARTSRDIYFGMGAFNMVRAASYRQAGGHAKLQLEVIDDIMLGKLMKEHGFRQDVVMGLAAVRIEWYRTAGDFMRGLEKNTYAMLDFSVARLAVMTLATLVIRYWPVAGLFLTSGAAWWLNAGSIVCAVLIHAEIMPVTRWSWRCFWWWPFTPAIMLAILWRAVALTIRRGGVSWRGTLYPLDALKSARRAQATSHASPSPPARGPGSR